ncbi:transcriptional regulator [Kitasatospora camelliae]|uniref:Transcriptional regulator n=1 Tax=Kitasatospora camelliae TaxID=3156397 RepID=A0AAU8K1D1_9ACTN
MTRTSLAPTLPRRRRSGCAPATAFEAVLADLAADRATGALNGPAGTVHLVDGGVVHAESPQATDVGTLLTRSGRIAPQEWEDCLLLSGGRPAEYLLATGQVGRGELQLCRLTALFDAAFFVLVQDDGEFRFTPDAVPMFSLPRPMPVPDLRGAVGRRRALLDRVWPSTRLDTAPVRPRPGPPPATRSRRAVLGAADGRRAPGDIARLLGRSGYGTLLDVRHLAAAGLVETAPLAAEPKPPAPVPFPAPPETVAPSVLLPGTPYDQSDPEVSLLLRLRAALEAL